mmetsp:Transcript_20638/g.47331  ORF Transcript_20638/g.47331 Transcript_20638/m.47331 type:complete len:203 (+) Transcript_20638:3273-3881(+)
MREYFLINGYTLSKSPPRRCEQFKRKISVPHSTIFSIISSLHEAGPKLATTLVFLLLSSISCGFSAILQLSTFGAELYLYIKSANVNFTYSGNLKYEIAASPSRPQAVNVKTESCWMDQPYWLERMALLYTFGNASNNAFHSFTPSNFSALKVSCFRKIVQQSSKNLSARTVSFTAFGNRPSSLPTLISSREYMPSEGALKF